MDARGRMTSTGSFSGKVRSEDVKVNAGAWALRGDALGSDAARAGRILPLLDPRARKQRKIGQQHTISSLEQNAYSIRWARYKTKVHGPERHFLHDFNCCR